MFNMSAIKIGADRAIADAGATSHFLLPGAQVLNTPPTKYPLCIHLPDGTLKSAHTATLDVPWLPEETRQAHIVPGLSQTLLISIKKLCDAGCIVTYNEKECKVEYKGKIVLSGIREPCTGLWILPLKLKPSQIYSQRSYIIIIHPTTPRLK